MEPTVAYIIEKFLRENGYDGLYNPGECACVLGDIAPCAGESFIMECHAGYKIPCSCGGDHDFDIGEKE